MSKAWDWVTIHFKEDSIPGLRHGQLTEESKQQIKAVVLTQISDNYHEGGNTETLIEKINSL
jgi:hypothetical protein